jgi:hypothetical protein
VISARARKSSSRWHQPHHGAPKWRNTRLSSVAAWARAASRIARASARGLEHPVKEATLEVYADLLATLGQTFLQTRYHSL